MKTTLQICLVLVVVLQFFLNLHKDFNGQKAKEPAGFHGTVLTVVSLLVALGFYYGAGAFSNLLP